VRNNNATTGGGIANQAALNLTGAVITGNVASMDGGGIANEGGTVTLTKYNTIARNSPDNCIPLVPSWVASDSRRWSQRARAGFQAPGCLDARASAGTLLTHRPLDAPAPASPKLVLEERMDS